MMYYKIEFIAPDGVIETFYKAVQYGDKLSVMRSYKQEFTRWARERWWQCYDNYYADDMRGFINNCNMKVTSITLSEYAKNA